MKRSLFIYAPRIAIGAILILAVAAAVFIWSPYEREQKIAQKITALRGTVAYKFCGPQWVSRSAQRWLPFLNRIERVKVTHQQEIPSDLFAELAALPHLTAVDLSMSRTQNLRLEELKRLPHLTYLHLGGTDLTNSQLEYLKSLRGLKYLLIQQSGIDDAGLEHLKDLTNLKYISLRWTGVTDQGLLHLRKLKNLERLDFYSTSITDVGLVHLAGLPRLKYIELGHGSRTTPEGRAILRQALPNCDVTPAP